MLRSAFLLKVLTDEYFALVDFGHRLVNIGERIYYCLRRATNGMHDPYAGLGVFSEEPMWQ